jgi:hypothetical protein
MFAISDDYNNESFVHRGVEENRVDIAIVERVCERLW